MWMEELRSMNIDPLNMVIVFSEAKIKKLDPQNIIIKLSNNEKPLLLKELIDSNKKYEEGQQEFFYVYSSNELNFLDKEKICEFLINKINKGTFE